MHNGDTMILTHYSKGEKMKFELVSPILGFESTKEVELERFDDFFMIMRDVNNPDISFTLIDPFVLREYDFEIGDATSKLLGINDSANVITQNIVLLQNPIQNSMVNFAAPLVFNTDTKKAAQVVMDNNSAYGVAEAIYDHLS